MSPEIPSPPKAACAGCPSREERHSQRHAAIVEKAIELFARHGYADTDTQQLADALSVGKGTIYRYFGSKEELFLAAVDCGMRKLYERMEPHLASDLDPLEKIRRGIRTYLDFFVEHPEVVEMLVQERALFKDRRKPTYFQHRERNIPRWQALYCRLMDQDRVRRMPPQQITDIVGDLLWGTMFTNYFSGRTTDPQRQAEAILDIVFLGILTGDERCACQAQSKAAANRETASDDRPIASIVPGDSPTHESNTNIEGARKLHRTVKSKKV